jgi:hypothetical protein
MFASWLSELLSALTPSERTHNTWAERTQGTHTDGMGVPAVEADADIPAHERDTSTPADEHEKNALDPCDDPDHPHEDGAPPDRSQRFSVVSR